MSHQPTTLCEALQRTVQRFGDHPALRAPDKTEMTWNQFAARVAALAAGLQAAGIEPGDTVALMLTNRAEAYLVDAAALHIRATPFSIYNTSSAEQVAYLLDHAETKLVVTERQFAGVIERAVNGFANPPQLTVVDRAAGLGEIEHSGGAVDLAEAAAAVRPSDVAVLIYTSGTTGPPKGVELTHANIAAEYASAEQVLALPDAGDVVSYLPMAHIADRIVSYYPALFNGSTINPVPDPRQIIAALPGIRPSTFMAVPRIWEKLKGALETKFAAEADPARRAAIAEGLDAGLQRWRLRARGEPVPEALQAAFDRVEATTFAPLRQALGFDRLRLAFSGAASIAPQILEFYAAIGIEILEGWSLSEAAANGCCNRPGEMRFGTVGRAMPGMEVSLARDGELLLKGPCVMRGYRKDPQKTAEAIDPDGWLRTGDLGVIEPDGSVRIIGRKKELMINAFGKNMSPNNIEDAIKAESALIGPLVAIGDARPYNTALVVLDPETAAVYAQARGLAEVNAAALAGDERVHLEVAAAVERGNARLSRAEQIKKFTILPVEWSPGGDELTPTLKLRRAAIAAKYAEQIDAMYRG